MPSLRDTQAAFGDAIRSGDPGCLASQVIGAGIAPEQRIGIYRNTSRLNALAAMQSTYPVIERLGGADWFAQSVARYQDCYPSSSGDLQNLGAHYPEFLRSYLAGTSFAYFTDVAALEWTYQMVLIAAESGSVELSILQTFDPDDYERLLFVPRRALGLVESQAPLFAIWQANQPSAPPDVVVRLDAGASRVLLIRRADHVEVRELRQASYLLLQQFRLGVTLGDAAAAVAAVCEPFDLPLSLRELLGLQVIADIILADGPQKVRSGEFR